MPSDSPLGVALAKVRSHGLKYSLVSVVNVAIGQGLLFLFHAVAHVGPTISNVLAVSVSAIPAYYLTRAWVWGKRGRSHLYREVLPFWGFALAGLILSSIAVTVASSAFGVEPGQDDWRRLIPNLANIAAFGVLWVVKFFVLDTYMFGPGHHTPDDEDDAVDLDDERIDLDQV